MRHRTLLPGSLCSLACLLPAQPRTYVVPPAYTAAEAPTRLSFPFAGNSALRLQFVYSMQGQVGVISQVAWRRDNDVVMGLNQVNYQAFTADFDLSLSSSPRTPVTISKTFANNHGADVRMVHTGMVNWPAEPFLPPGPSGFNFTVPIPLPFLFTGQTDLCVDIVRRAFPNPNPSFFFDATANTVGTGIVKIGDGCPSATVNSVVVYDNWAAGALARVLQYNAANGSPVALVVGDNSLFWGSLPLPFDLGAIGMPGCWVYSNHVLTIPGINTNPTAPYTGRWDFTTEIPNNPLLAGTQIYLQFYNLVDTQIGNALNVSVSQAYQVTFATPAPNKPWVSEAHGSSLTGPDAQLVQQGYGYVSQFTY